MEAARAVGRADHGRPAGRPRPRLGANGPGRKCGDCSPRWTDSQAAQSCRLVMSQNSTAPGARRRRHPRAASATSTRPRSGPAPAAPSGGSSRSRGARRPAGWAAGGGTPPRSGSTPGSGVAASEPSSDIDAIPSRSTIAPPIQAPAGRSCRRSPAATPGTARGGSAGSGSTRGSSRRSPSSSRRPRRSAGRRPPASRCRTARAARPARRRTARTAAPRGAPSGCSACPNTQPCQTSSGSSTRPCSAVSNDSTSRKPGRPLQRPGQVVGPGVVGAADRPLGRRPPSSGSSSCPRCRQVFANIREPRRLPRSRTTRQDDVADHHGALGDARSSCGEQIGDPAETRPPPGEQVPAFPRQHLVGGVRRRGQHLHQLASLGWCEAR